ncbi:hypothetical protein GCM10009742_58460 [Kribbella karoonensis]|uniref:Uncharacterized protein n=1 Tax=Kribbella karoonensis TaxID=324851 RepID=A0ABN2ECJ0_9ACTN
MPSTPNCSSAACSTPTADESPDIMHLCRQSLDQLDIPWRMPRPNALSVARREGVQRLDTFIGPKS